jgi:hypothetical protein
MPVGRRKVGCGVRLNERHSRGDETRSEAPAAEPAKPAPPAVPAHRILALQQSAGNRAVARMVAQRPVTAPVRMLLRERDDYDNQGAAVVPSQVAAGYVAMLRVAVDSAVTTAHETLIANPLNPALATVNGYTRRWLDVCRIFLTDRSQAEFLHTTFGYAIESLACMQLTDAPPPGVELVLQATRGATRPDIVVKENGADIAWLDITSNASYGHIFKKQGGGWRRVPYVSEVFYPALDPNSLGVGGGGVKQEGELLAALARNAVLEKKVKARRGLLVGAFPAPRGGNAMAVRSKNVQTDVPLLLGAIAPNINGEHVSPRAVKSVIVDVLGDPALANYGFKGAKKQGRDRETARQLLYGDLLDIKPEDRDVFNEELKVAYGNAQPSPAEGLGEHELFGGGADIGVSDVGLVGYGHSRAPEISLGELPYMQEEKLEVQQWPASLFGDDDQPSAMDVETKEEEDDDDDYTRFLADEMKS